MTSAELQGAVMAALNAAQKPLTQAAALSIATDVLTVLDAGKEAIDFGKWFERNGAWLVERVNRA